MNLLSRFVSFFTKITTGILLICCLGFKASGVEQCTTDTLWQVPLLGLITSVISVVVLADKDCSRKEAIIRFVVHYVLISASVLVLGALFGWYKPSVLGCAVMLLYIAAVYGFSYGSNYISEKRSADELNKALDRRRNGK